mgnify:FL=1
MLRTKIVCVFLNPWNFVLPTLAVHFRQLKVGGYKIKSIFEISWFNFVTFKGTAMPDLNKILQESNADKVDAIKLLKLLYNYTFSDDVVKTIYTGRVDETMLAWLQEKAKNCSRTFKNNADAWINFLLDIDRDYLQIAIEYINDLII